MRRLLPLLLSCSLGSIALQACHRCPPPVTPRPTIQLSKSPECVLPALPGPIHPAIGFPDENGIYLTKSDFAELANYVMALRDWVLAAQPCLSVNQ